VSAASAECVIVVVAAWRYIRTAVTLLSLLDRLLDSRRMLRYRLTYRY